MPVGAGLTSPIYPGLGSSDGTEIGVSLIDRSGSGPYGRGGIERRSNKEIRDDFASNNDLCVRRGGPCRAVLAVGVGGRIERLLPAVRRVGPGQSIQAAIDAAPPGSTIHIEPGTYTEQLVITKNRIRLEGSGARLVAPSTFTPNQCTGVAHVGPPNVTGPPANSGICIIGDVKFGDFDLFLGHRPATEVRRAVSGVTVSGLQISGFPVGVLIAGGERTAIEDNQIDGAGPYGILATNSARTRYADNTIVHGPAGVAGIGACVEGSTGSTIAGNDVSGFITGLCISSSQVGVRGNRVHDNHFGIFTDPGYHDIDIQDNQVEHNTRGPRFLCRPVSASSSTARTT